MVRLPWRGRRHGVARVRCRMVENSSSEGVVAHFEPPDLIGVAVEGDDRRNRREQSDGGGDQRFGNSGRHHGERRLLHVPEAGERTHDAPHRAEQAHVRAGRADRRERREAVLQPIDLLQLRDAHGAPRAFEQLVRRDAALLALARELAEPELEDARPCRWHRRATRCRDRAARDRRPTRSSCSNWSASRRARLITMRLLKMIAHDMKRCEQQDADDDLHRHRWPRRSSRMIERSRVHVRQRLLGEDTFAARPRESVAGVSRVEARHPHLRVDQQIVSASAVDPLSEAHHGGAFALGRTGDREPSSSRAGRR